MGNVININLPDKIESELEQFICKGVYSNKQEAILRIVEEGLKKISLLESPKKLVSLRGMWRELEGIDMEDFQEAKKIWTNKIGEKF